MLKAKKQPEITDFKLLFEGATSRRARPAKAGDGHGRQEELVREYAGPVFVRAAGRTHEHDAASNHRRRLAPGWRLTTPPRTGPAKSRDPRWALSGCDMTEQHAERWASSLHGSAGELEQPAERCTSAPHRRSPARLRHEHSRAQRAAGRIDAPRKLKRTQPAPRPRWRAHRVDARLTDARHDRIDAAAAKAARTATRCTRSSSTPCADFSGFAAVLGRGLRGSPSARGGSRATAASRRPRVRLAALSHR